MKIRYQMMMDAEMGKAMICDLETGTIQYPACWQDLFAYYHYLSGRNRMAEAHEILAECMRGGKPISRMVDGLKNHPARPAARGVMDYLHRHASN